MSKFLKLSKLIINTSYIKNIIIEPTVYHIQFIDHTVSGMTIFGGGYVDSTNSTLIVCKEKHTKDYQFVSEWIQKNAN